MFEIIFEDNSTFKGGKNIENSKWNDMPNKRIIQLNYTFLGHEVTLKGYESYNHLVEKVNNINQGITSITKVILLAKKTNNEVKRIIFDINKNKVSSDDVVYGKEYKGRSTKGWKLGIPSSNTFLSIQPSN